MTHVQFVEQKSQPDFEKWVDNHPDGIVINSTPGRLRETYVKAHLPNCPSFEQGAKTKYSKHCFDSLVEALDTLDQLGMRRPTFGCTKCMVRRRLIAPTADPIEFQCCVSALLQDATKRVPKEPKGNRNPKRMEMNAVQAFQRDPGVAAHVLRISNGICELCRKPAPFKNSKGQNYLEVHHIQFLANGGSDTVDNAAALCPNCHRAVHYAENARALTQQLLASVRTRKSQIE